MEEIISNVITKIKTPKSGLIDHYFVASDWHTETLNIPTYKILKKLAKEHSRTRRRLVILGDFLDAPFLMRKKEDFKINFKRKNFEEHFIPLAEEEFAWGNQILDEMQDLFEWIYFVEGNHDWRYREFYNDKKVPHAYRPHFNLERQLDLKGRGIPFVKYNDFLDVGNMAFTHGFAHSRSHNNQHIDAVEGQSVMYGHVHHSNTTSKITRGKCRKAFSLPCMANTNPEYIKNRPSNWTNGFATVSVKSNGHFQAHILETWDNELVLPNGKTIRP